MEGRRLNSFARHTLSPHGKAPDFSPDDGYRGPAAPLWAFESFWLFSRLLEGGRLFLC